jgi:RNA polymerase sigma-70 factor (ECF subfamily)
MPAMKMNWIPAHRRSAERADPASRGPDHVAMVAALRHISADQRRAIVLFYVAETTIEEISSSASSLSSRGSSGHR